MEVEKKVSIVGYNHYNKEKTIFEKGAIVILWRKVNDKWEEETVVLNMEDYEKLKREIKLADKSINFTLPSICLEEDFDIWKKGIEIYYYDKPQDLTFMLMEMDGMNILKCKEYRYKEIYKNKKIKKIYDYFNPSYSFRII